MYSPKVVVIDSGVDKENKIIMPHIIQGFSFQRNVNENRIIECSDFNDIVGHGTNCIDCILQLAEWAQFYPIKIINEFGKTTCTLLIEALKKCKEIPVDIICLSLSVTRFLEDDIEIQLDELCQDLKRQGKIICASECNNTKNSIPAIYNSVIGVGELPIGADRKILVNKFEKVQVKADIAPIFVAGKQGRFNFFKGTSKANAYVTGILARAMQTENGLISFDDVLDVLEKEDIAPEVIDTQNVGKVQTDELGQLILKKIQKTLLRFGCNSTLDEISKYPFLSKITGINFFNFYDFIIEVHKELEITECNFHTIEIRDVCLLFNLVEYLKKEIWYEKKKYGIRTNSEI